VFVTALLAGGLVAVNGAPIGAIPADDPGHPFANFERLLILVADPVVLAMILFAVVAAAVDARGESQ